MTSITVSYKDLNLEFVNKPRKEPTSPKEYWNLLFPKDIELSDEYMKRENVYPIVIYVLEKMKDEPLQNIYETQVIERCYSYLIELKEYKLLLEYIEIFKTQQYLYFMKNSEHKDTFFENDSALIYYYITARWQQSLLNELDEDLLISMLKTVPQIRYPLTDKPLMVTIEILISLLNANKHSMDEIKFFIVRLSSFILKEGYMILSEEEKKPFYEGIEQQLSLFSGSETYKKTHEFFQHLLSWSHITLEGMCLLDASEDVDLVDTNRTQWIYESGKILETLTKTIYLENEKHIEKIVEGIMLRLSQELYLTNAVGDQAVDTLSEIFDTTLMSTYKKDILQKYRLNEHRLHQYFQRLFENGKYKTYYRYLTRYLTRGERATLEEKLMFQTAYVYAEHKKDNDAIGLYTRLLNEDGPDTSVYNNLALLYMNKKEYAEALRLLKLGEEMDSEKESIQLNLKEVHKLIKEEEMRPKRMKDAYFKKTYKTDKRLIFTIYKLQGEEKITDDKLRNLLTISDVTYYNKLMNKLLELELVLKDQQKGYILDPTIEELVQQYIDPKMERSIIKGDKNKLYRSIFYHDSEINLYRALLELFPQHLVFPNMDLKTIIEVDKIKEHLNSDVMEYMFKAHVDFAIINTRTYFPIITFEKDSDYQDTEPQKSNAAKKNLIFETSGLPLIRLRFNSAMDYERLKEEIKQTTKAFLLDVKSTDDNAELLDEFDLKRFGILGKLPSVDEVKEIWEKIVGSLISQNTKELVVNEEQAILIVHLSKDLKSIMELSQDTVKTQLYQQINSLNKVEFIFE
ncbi:hypothetical protein CN918_31840 [Priestia megaterium]|nr:hypothetical protein CN918_31840 [Priestia megaterium]